MRNLLTFLKTSPPKVLGIVSAKYKLEEMVHSINVTAGMSVQNKSNTILTTKSL